MPKSGSIRRGVRFSVLAFASFCAAIALERPVAAGSFSVSGFSFDRFEKHRDSCYQCNGGGDGETAAPDPREVERASIIRALDFAWARNDLRKAVELAFKALAIRDDPKLRDWIRIAQAGITLEEGNTAAAAGDHHRALALYRQALDLSPNILIDMGEFRRYEASVLAQEQRDAAARAEQEQRQTRLKAWTDANDQAVGYLRQGRWNEALAAYETVLRNQPDSDGYLGMPVDLPREITVNRSVAIAAVARSQGKLDEAIRWLQSALSYDQSNEIANTLLRVAYEERAKTATTMQAELQRTREALDLGNAVDARGPKPLADLIATIPELAASPQAERARKGLVAAANHDWKLALAWYQDALNRDPGNPALTRAVDLAQWMVKARPAAGPLPQTSTSPAKDMISIPYDPLDPSGMWAGYAKEHAKLYTEVANDLAGMKFTRDEDKARAAYYAGLLRDRAQDIIVSGEATAKQALQPQSPLTFK